MIKSYRVGRKKDGGHRMILKASAKINLMLDILGTTEDGYHSLYMVMQSISIQDTVTVEKTGKKDEISLSCSNSALPCDRRNIAWKAAELYFENTDNENPGIDIHIEKVIPFAAGLAGGSADAAAVFTGLNAMAENPVDIETLCRIGEKAGADVPYCIKGGTMLALDIGGVLAPLPSVRKDYYVLVKPDQDVSTKEAYAAADACTNMRHLDRQGMLRSLVTGNMDGVYERIGNVFEQFVEVPDRVYIKSIMREHGAIRSCMSGSGPTVYGIFKTGEQAESCVKHLKKEGFNNTFLCQPVDKGVEIVG